LKVLIQLMAAAVAGRSIVYFTFGDTQLRDNISMMYTHLVQHDIDIGINFIYLNNKIIKYKNCYEYVTYIYSLFISLFY